MIMATTVQQAVDPLLVTTSFIGLGIYFRKKPRLYLNILCSVTVWTVYIYIFYCIVITLKLHVWLANIITIINFLISSLITITSIATVICYDKKFRIFMKRITAVDDTLEELGTPKVYRKLQLRAKGMIIVWIIYCCSANINDMIWWFYMVDDSRVLFIPYIINHYRHVNVFVDLAFIIFVWYIGTRFDKVNEHMRCLLIKENHGLRCRWREAAPITRRFIMCTDNYKRVLWTSMHLHLELCQIARELNVMYGTQMTLEMSSHLFFMIGLCRYVYIVIITGNKSQNPYIASRHIWFYIPFLTFLYGSRLFYLNYVCETVGAKANEIKKIIHQLTDSLRYADIRDEIYQFTLQLMYHPLRFTGMGLFYFGYGFLRKFCLTVATFVIITVQMSQYDPYNSF